MTLPGKRCMAAWRSPSGPSTIILRCTLRSIGNCGCRLIRSSHAWTKDCALSSETAYCSRSASVRHSCHSLPVPARVAGMALFLKIFYERYPEDATRETSGFSAWESAYDSLLNRVGSEFGDGAEPERLHNAVLMVLDSPVGNVQHCGNFFRRLSFSEQLQYFPLAGGQ